jgi:5-hydroxyisourate hydrolase
MGKLTTHILDTANGKAAAGIKIEVFLVEGAAFKPLKTMTTNRDGRTDQPLADGDGFRGGTYQLVFHVGDYFRAQGNAAGFLDEVPVRFTIADAAQNYHVPLLCSPWSYTTYRGS